MAGQNEKGDGTMWNYPDLGRIITFVALAVSLAFIVFAIASLWGPTTATKEAPWTPERRKAALHLTLDEMRRGSVQRYCERTSDGGWMSTEICVADWAAKVKGVKKFAWSDQWRGILGW